MTNDPTSPSPGETLEAALTREHRDIDTGIEEFVAGAEQGDLRSEPLTRAMDALRRHIYLEETILFPPLRAAGLMMPVMVMLREHGALWDAMAAIDTGLADLEKHDSPAVSSMIEQCRQLLALLDEHNGKEEPILYPRADLDLDEAAHDDLADFLHSGEIPDGWSCQTATV